MRQPELAGGEELAKFHASGARAGAMTPWARGEIGDFDSAMLRFNPNRLRNSGGRRFACCPAVLYCRHSRHRGADYGGRNQTAAGVSDGAALFLILGVLVLLAAAGAFWWTRHYIYAGEIAATRLTERSSRVWERKLERLEQAERGKRLPSLAPMGSSGA